MKPMLLAALPRTMQRLLLIGDHEQLRPMLEEEQLSSDHGHNLDVSLMERLVKQQGFRNVSYHSGTISKASERLQK